MPIEFIAEPPKKWYKTGKGIVFIFFGFLLLSVFLVFIGFFSYYAIKIKYGDASVLNKEFAATKFSEDTNLSSTETKNNVGDISKYIRNFNPLIGSATAPVTIMAFVDFECPYSQEAYSGFKDVVEKYQPVIRVVLKELPLTDLHVNALNAALAASCANRQGKFWEYYNGLFTNKVLTVEGLLSQANIVGLDQTQFANCFDDKITENEVNMDATDAVALGVRGTPTYFVNGLKVEGVKSGEDWDKIILQVLNK